MKYKVIGWTDYENEDIEDGDCSDAAYHAIIDDVRASGYCFSGYAHQELSLGVPVLNDGKKRCFSQRSWSGLMARAHGKNAPMDYSLYAFSLGHEKMPPTRLWICAEDAAAQASLNEEIKKKVTRSVFEKAARELCFLDEDHRLLRYLDVGDTLTLTCENDSASYLVKDLERGWDYNDGVGEMHPVFLDDIQRILYCGSCEEKERAQSIYATGRRLLSVRLEKIRA